MPLDDLPLLTFADAAAFAAWLAEQPDNARGAWLRFAKKGAPEATVSKADAIACALAEGWIDGQLGRVDQVYFKTRFTPRRPGSRWSLLNRTAAERLMSEGRMNRRGLAEVEAARADGRWERAYEPQSLANPDDELQAALDANPAARALFDELDAANRYAVLYRVRQAGGAGKRTAKIAELVAKLAKGETFHPRRQRRK